MLADCLLHSTAARIGSYLMHRANADSGKAFPEMRTIAEEGGLELRAVERGIGKLVERGWLISRRIRSNQYTLSWDPRLVEKIDDLRFHLKCNRDEDRLALA